MQLQRNDSKKNICDKIFNAYMDAHEIFLSSFFLEDRVLVYHIFIDRA